MATLPTVRVKNPSKPGDFVVINELDFDPKRHEPFTGEGAGKDEEQGGGQNEGTPDIGPTLPDGYALEHVSGGYYQLFGPEGQLIEGPANGKWRGEDAALAAALDHAAARPSRG